MGSLAARSVLFLAAAPGAAVCARRVLGLPARPVLPVRNRRARRRIVLGPGWLPVAGTGAVRRAGRLSVGSCIDSVGRVRLGGGAPAAGSARLRRAGVCPRAGHLSRTQRKRTLLRDHHARHLVACVPGRQQLERGDRRLQRYEGDPEPARAGRVQRHVLRRRGRPGGRGGVVRMAGAGTARHAVARDLAERAPRRFLRLRHCRAQGRGLRRKRGAGRGRRCAVRPAAGPGHARAGGLRVVRGSGDLGGGGRPPARARSGARCGADRHHERGAA